MAKYFTGTFFHKLDSKGRVSLPSDFRDVLRDQQSPSSIVVLPAAGSDAAHTVYSLTGHERLVDLVEDEVFDDPEEEEATRRYYIGSARRLQVDDGGRIVLPKELQTAIGLVSEIGFEGDGSAFKLWEPGALRSRITPDASAPSARPRRMRARALHR